MGASGTGSTGGPNNTCGRAAIAVGTTAIAGVIAMRFATMAMGTVYRSVIIEGNIIFAISWLRINFSSAIGVEFFPWVIIRVVVGIRIDISFLVRIFFQSYFPPISLL